MSLRDEAAVRTPDFKRNRQLEELLATLNAALQCADEKLISRPGREYPVVFIMGPLRSGTTLFMQWLASTGAFAYPTNLLSRFYGAPLTGAHIQQLLTDPRFNFRDEILDFSSEIDFESRNGKTRGALAPNEFWYFWRRFLPFEDIDWLPDEVLLERVERERLVAELAGLTRVFGKPFALKGMILNHNIRFLNEVFGNALFIRIERDPVANVASILDARRRQLGSEHAWYSFKIPEYPLLKDLDPVTQCAGQLHYINQAVAGGMAGVADERKLHVRYEDFCASPEAVFAALADKLDLPDRQYRGPCKFDVSRSDASPRRDEILRALARFEPADDRTT